MEALLVILIVFNDSGTEPLAKEVAAEISRLGGDGVQVVIGADAKAQIEKRDVKIADLLAPGNIGNHLTANEKNLVIIHLDRNLSAGDVVVDSRVWVEGRADRHVAIGGNGAEPTAGVVNGVLPVIIGKFPNHAAKAGAKQDGDETRLAQMAEHKQWSEILGQLASVKDKTPRQFYYQVLAYCRLGQRDPAVESLNLMRKAHPDHFLIAAAEELIPPKPAELKVDGTDDDTSNTLKDPVPVGAEDDGSNTLK